MKKLNLNNLGEIDVVHAKCTSLFTHAENLIKKAQLISLTKKVQNHRNSQIPAVTGVSKGRVLR